MQRYIPTEEKSQDCHFCGESRVFHHHSDPVLFCSELCETFFRHLLALHTSPGNRAATYSLARRATPASPHRRSATPETIHDIIMRTGGYPVHCAHRGGGFELGPENTMYTFRRSVAHRARLLEIDIHLTQDKHLVLIHSSSVNTTTNGDGLVANYTLAALRALDAAHNYPHLRATGITVPTLAEFLDEFAAIPDLLFMLDFKDSEALHATLAFIGPYAIGNRVILGALSGAPNSELRRLRHSPDIPVITDITQTFKIIAAYLTGLLDRYTFVHEICGFILLPATLIFWSRALVDAIHARGCRMLVCGAALNHPLRLRECLEWGVDFIMTDRSDVLDGMLAARIHTPKSLELLGNK